jgi:hypothetical protein
MRVSHGSGEWITENGVTFKGVRSSDPVQSNERYFNHLKKPKCIATDCENEVIFRSTDPLCLPCWVRHKNHGDIKVRARKKGGDRRTEKMKAWQKSRNHEAFRRGGKAKWLQKPENGA